MYALRSRADLALYTILLVLGLLIKLNSTYDLILMSKIEFIAKLHEF